MRISRSIDATASQPLSFYPVVEAGRRKGETAIGYRLLAEASQPEQLFGVHLNPNKSEPSTFGQEDRVIAVAAG